MADEGFTTDQMAQMTGLSPEELEATQIHKTTDLPDDAQPGQTQEGFTTEQMAQMTGMSTEELDATQIPQEN